VGNNKKRILFTWKLVNYVDNLIDSVCLIYAIFDHLRIDTGRMLKLAYIKSILKNYFILFNLVKN